MNSKITPLVKRATTIQGRVLIAGRPVTDDMTASQKATQAMLNACFKRPASTASLL